MAGNVRYQIFVSSTYTDLFPVRRKVTEHILSMNHIPAGMEMFSASGREQWRTIQKAIDNSDYYVLIIGERYGSISENEGISFTEKEFDYARSKNIPTLCFLPDSSFSTSREHRESDPIKIEKLELFKQKVRNDQLCSFWASEDELATKVSASLYKIFIEEPGVGWIRGNATDTETLSKLVRVMEENNELKARLQEMEARHKDSPDLLMLFNGYDCSLNPMEIITPDFNHPTLSDQELKIDDIPLSLKHRVSVEDIDEYNDKIPTSEAIESFNNEMRTYLRAQAGVINISIKNMGPIKANNVSVRMTLPDGLKALASNDVELMEPLPLKLPLNPIELQKMNPFQRNQALRNQSIIISQHRLPVLHDPNRELFIQGKNIIKGKVKSVRQATTESVNSDIHLVAEYAGMFDIKIELLCDEYRQWDTKVMRVIVS